MFWLARILLLLTSAALGPLPQSLPSFHRPLVGLSTLDQQQGALAAHLAGQSPYRALRWLAQQHGIQSARLGRDGATIDVHFRDGAEVAILPKVSRSPSLQPRQSARIDDRILPEQTSPGRAIVLEPFANELLRGTDAGQSEIDTLTKAGFKVDVVRNGDVTVNTMETLGNYSVVYMETHSGVLPDGDAIVVTGQTDTGPYTSLYQEHSLIQAFVAGQSKSILYNAITGTFVSRHMGTFPDSSLVFLNGCSILQAPIFWDDLHQRNVATMISWDHDVYSSITQTAADVIFSHLVSGATVADSISAAHQAGVDASFVGDTEAHLGFLGDGNDTIANALAGATPTPTATPVATITPTPTSLAVHLKHEVAPHSRQTIRVQTDPQATAHFTVSFPNGHHHKATRIAGATGTATYSYTQSGSEITHWSRVARVVVKVGAGQTAVTEVAHYRIAFGPIDISAVSVRHASSPQETIWVHTRRRGPVDIVLRHQSKVIRVHGRTGAHGWLRLRVNISRLKVTHHQAVIVQAQTRVAGHIYRAKTRFTVA